MPSKGHVRVEFDQKRWHVSGESLHTYLLQIKELLGWWHAMQVTGDAMSDSSLVSSQIETIFMLIEARDTEASTLNTILVL